MKGNYGAITVTEAEGSKTIMFADFFFFGLKSDNPTQLNDLGIYVYSSFEDPDDPNWAHTFSCSTIFKNTDDSIEEYDPNPIVTNYALGASSFKGDDT